LECTYPGKLNHLAYADNHVPEDIVVIFSELLVASEKRPEIYLLGVSHSRQHVVWRNVHRGTAATRMYKQLDKKLRERAQVVEENIMDV
jgi:hypothetical protein